MMTRFPARLSAIAAVTFSVALAVPAYCQNPILPPASPPPPASPNDGLTRESLNEPSAPTHAAVTRSATAATARKHRERAEIDPKDFVAIHRPHRHREVAEHRPAAKKQAIVAVSKPAARRNPVESFVFWWNGWVVRNFHTRNGTVLFDKIGAKS